MENSKVITLLKTLNKKEIKEFGDYINAKNNKEVAVFFKCICSYHPDYKVKNINKKKFCKKYYPNLNLDIKNDSSKITKMMHQLVQCLDEFFIQKEVKENSTEKDFLLLSAYKKRKLDNFFFKKANQLQKRWSVEKPPGLEHLNNIYKLKYIYFMHPNYSKIDVKSNVDEKLKIGPETLLEHLDKYYIATKLYFTLCLKHTSFYIANKSKFKEPEWLIDEIIKVTNTHSFVDVPQINLLSEILKSMTNNDYENYADIKSNFLKYFDLYSKIESNDITSFLHTICYENYKSGMPGSLQELFELNCLMEKKDLLKEDGYIQTYLFWNIINIGFAAKEFDWTKKFINQNSKYLKEDEKKDVIFLCNSMVFFQEGNFENSLKNLNNVKFHNVTYGLMARAIQLQCYYELGERYEQSFLDLIKSFQMFINRNNFGEKTKKNVSNFISFIKSLYTLKLKGNRGNSIKLEAIIKNLNETKNIAYKSWLLAKIKEFDST